MWGIVKLTETQEECNIMNQCIVEFIDKILLRRLILETQDPTTKINAHQMHSMVQSFYCNKVWPNHSKYCNPFFRHKMHLGITSSNACEQEFSVIKARHTNRVFATDSLHVSFCKMTDIDASRRRKKAREDHKRLMSTPTNSQDCDRLVPMVTFNMSDRLGKFPNCTQA